MARLSEGEVRERASRIELMVLDVDGVLTDGRIIYTSAGEEIKNFDVKDGHGIVLARGAGIKFALVSGRTSEVTDLRARDLKIENVLQGVREKDAALRELSLTFNVGMELIAFMGDDVIDIPAMKIAGLSAAPQNAHPRAMEFADWVASRKGGRGAVRELIDLTLESRA